MKAQAKITFLDENENKFFGEGPAKLLHAIEEHGSLRTASMSMGMAYTKALKILRNAENALGFPLTTRTAGGKSGGGSRLTPKGMEWLIQYENYRNACIRANQQLYLEFFSDVGCVIMASGMGKRFGENKLLTDFNGKPLISHILDITSGIFKKRIVVTRHPEIVSLCKELDIEVIIHSLPHKSDTIRLGLEQMTDTKSCMFCTADQPLLQKDTIAALVLESTNAPTKIIRPIFENTPGSPVIFPQWTYEELLHLSEEQSGGYIIKKHPDFVQYLPVHNSYELEDIDTKEDIIRLQNFCAHSTNSLR